MSWQRSVFNKVHKQLGPYSIVFREGHHPFIVMDGVEGKKHLWTDSCTCKLIHVRASTYIQKTYCIVHPPYFYRKLMVMNNYTDREAAYTLDLLPITPTWHTLVWYVGNLWKNKKTMRTISRRMHHFCRYFFSNEKWFLEDFADFKALWVYW